MTGDGIYTLTDRGTGLEGILAMTAPPWMARGLCAQTDPEAWFPDKGGSTREAKRICATCPVAAECLDYALEHGERYGIWGGLSERERRKISTALGISEPRPIKRSHCRQGHPLSEDTVYRHADGGYSCAECGRAKANARRAQINDHQNQEHAS